MRFTSLSGTLLLGTLCNKKKIPPGKHRVREKVKLVSGRGGVERVFLPTRFINGALLGKKKIFLRLELMGGLQDYRKWCNLTSPPQKKPLGLGRVEILRLVSHVINHGRGMSTSGALRERRFLVQKHPKVKGG
ncbi:hypothetical protein CEXT_394621 [Caerostris extrusa]|uniref:Uncharacterized protein n=1 Tax=Caerostris extrusa TaxID=172846 RepID=A0AAV4VMM3_CAEEX|nr:hypothetical protein CEXT_394621 [Caerostris extrusa]